MWKLWNKIGIVNFEALVIIYEVLLYHRRWQFGLEIRIFRSFCLLSSWSSWIITIEPCCLHEFIIFHGKCFVRFISHKILWYSILSWQLLVLRIGRKQSDAKWKGIYIIGALHGLGSGQCTISVKVCRPSNFGFPSSKAVKQSWIQFCFCQIFVVILKIWQQDGRKKCTHWNPSQIHTVWWLVAE